MIPIECPKCGREGNVPPDRLNAKLTCRGCQAVFHLDNSGRMVMGSPGEPGKDKGRPHVQYSKPGEPFNLGEALRGIPKPVKFGVPAVLLALAVWQLLPGGGAGGYEGDAGSIVRSLLNNDKSRVVSYSTTESADAAGKWFDLIHAEAEKQAIPAGTMIAPSLFSGNPDRDANLIVMVVLRGDSPSASPLPLNLHLARSGGSWRLDGAKTFADAESLIAVMSKKPRP